MKALLLESPGKAQLREVASPEPGRGEILVRVTACGVCHTDLHYLDHGVPTFKSPVILGHEVSGTVAGCGAEVEKFREGDRVLLPAVFTCGACRMCRTGRENICQQMKMLGNHLDGGFAEYVVAPAKDCFALPAEIPLAEGCLIGDALTTPYHAVKHRARVQLGDVVAVFGCGGDRDRGKRPVMGEISTRISDFTIITSDNPRSEDPLEIIKEIERGIMGGRKWEVGSGGKDFSASHIPHPITMLLSLTGIMQSGQQ